jgi:hypothetical protein
VARQGLFGQGRKTRPDGTRSPTHRAGRQLVCCPVALSTCARAIQSLNKPTNEGKVSGGNNVNKAIRWRIVTLQSMLVLILAGASGFLFSEGSFVTGMVHDELVAQQIYFPGVDQIKAGGALDPAEFPAEIRNYAGQQVDNGDKARVYAADFIGKHLQGIAKGQTYSQVSSAAMALNARIASTLTTDPNYATLQAQLATLNGQKATLFQGEMLRGTLLNSWGWWTLGVYTTYAGIGLLIAGMGALGALVFELFVVVRKPESIKVKLGQKVVA